MAHIKMLDMYNDIPHSYNIQKMIYDDNSTLQDVINQLNIPNNDAKAYDYKDNSPTPLVKDEIIGGNQTTGVAPENSETKKGGSMGLKTENKKSLKNQVSVPPPLCMTVLLRFSHHADCVKLCKGA